VRLRQCVSGKRGWQAVIDLKVADGKAVVIGDRFVMSRQGLVMGQRLVWLCGLYAEARSLCGLFGSVACCLGLVKYVWLMAVKEG